MIALDDGETEAGSLLARRHIGLGEAVTVLLRQADAIVGHADEGHRIVDARLDEDAALEAGLDHAGALRSPRAHS